MNDYERGCHSVLKWGDWHHERPTVSKEGWWEHKNRGEVFA